MSRASLRWWLFTCLTFVAMAVAGLFGLYSALLAHDVTYLSLAVIGAYVLATAWLGWKVWRGDSAYGLVWYLADVLERAGLYGTFVGMALAFQAVGHMDAAGAWKQELMLGVSTKFFCSLVGMAAAFFLRTQIKILDPDYAG